jgi:hypothetical protein
MIKDNSASTLTAQSLKSYSTDRVASWLPQTADSLDAARQVRRVRSSVDGGNTKGKATLLVKTSGSRTVRDAVRRQDVDYFSFKLDTVSNVKLTFLNRSGNSIVRTLIGPDGKVFTSKRTPQQGTLQPGGTLLSVYRRIRPGTYYIKLQGQSSSASQYKLDIAVTVPPPEADCGCGG